MSNRYEWENGKVYKNSNSDSAYIIDKKTAAKVCFDSYICDHSAWMEAYPEHFVYNDYEFWQFVCATAPDACVYTPKKFQTPDLIRVIANNTSDERNLKLMNMAVVEKMEGKEAVLEIYKTMVKRFYSALRDVPEEYRTDELIDIAITEHLAAFSTLLGKERTDKRCITAVSKWGRTLRSVPEEKKRLLVRTVDGEKKLFEVAIEVDGFSLKFVPKEEKNHDLCLQACSQNIEAITAVPATILTPYFVNELNERGIVIPPKHMPYVWECLKTYGKIEGLLSLNGDAVSARCISDHSSFRDVLLDKLSFIISKPILTKLAEKGITNLEELFTAYEKEDFPGMFTPKAYAEISGVVNALNCKFKDQDPMLDFSEDSCEYMVSKLGFSRKVAKQMEYKGIHVGELIEQAHLPLEQQVWGDFIRGVGDISISESLAKLFIFASYYDRHSKDLEAKRNSLDDRVIKLQQELEDLRNQRAVLDGKIDATATKIAELTKEKYMSGGKPYVKK